MDKLLVAFALGLGMLGTGDAWAAEQKVRVPFGPQAQSLALEWINGLTTAREASPSVSDVKIEPFEIRYLIATPALPDAATVTLHFDASAQAIRVTTQIQSDEVASFVQRVKTRLLKVISPERLQVVWPEAEEISEIQETEARGPPWWREVESTLVFLLLGGLFLGLLLSAPLLWRKIRGLTRQDAMALGALQALLVVVLWVADDTVLYHSGHGWAMAELIHQASTSDPHAGALAPLWSYLLGWPAFAGQEAFFASRVGMMMSAVLLWSWILLMTQQRVFAWMAVLILLAQPALFLAARSEYVASPGLALVLLTLNLVTLAGRERDWRLILAAASALGLLASFRALGPVVWPFCGLFFFAVLPHTPKKGLKSMAAASLVVGLCAIPSLFRVLGVGTSYMPKEGLALMPDFGQTQLLGDPIWTGPLLGVAALVCALAWMFQKDRKKRYRPSLAAIALLGMVWIIVVATQHVAGTYLNTPRYHLWLLLPSSVAIASFGSYLVERGRRVEIAAYAMALLVLGSGLLTPWSISLERHPEARQLDAWRAALKVLPEGATLLVPERRGEHEIKLPMTELRRTRPDVDVQRGTFTQTSGVFVFKPLDCLRPSLEPGQQVRDDCRTLTSGWTPVKDATRGTTWSVPSTDEDGVMEASTDADYWVYPALSDPPEPIGLFAR